MGEGLSGSEAEQIVRNDPRFHLFEEHFPGWTLAFRPLPNHGEIVNWKKKILVVDADSPDPVWSAAHAIGHAHLHYKLHKNDLFPKPISPVEELDANWMADMWLAWTTPFGHQQRRLSA